jgi:outer membrane receptor protein involved in Fe transport
MNRNLPPSAALRLAVASSLLLLCAALQGQATATPPPDNTVVELSPFTVNAAADRGYGASETMTGSRTKNLIIDLPYSVNVMTSEFMTDFGLFDLGDNVTQIGGFTGLDVGGNFVLRGFISSNQLRDGFFRLGRYGSSNIDRIEIIKGPSAAVYGRSSPGGMMNMISKQPKAKETESLALNYGDYATKRFVLETGGPLMQGTLGKTNYVLTLSDYQRGYDVPYSYIQNREAYLAVDHVFADKSKLFFSAEYFDQFRNSPLSTAPLIIDKKGTGTSATADADDVAVGYATNLDNVNENGPSSYLERGTVSFTTTYEKKINSVFSNRASVNVYKANRWDYNQNTGWGSIVINTSSAAINAVPSSTRGATPNRGRIFEKGKAFQDDLTAHYWIANHKVELQTLFTFDYNDYARDDPTFSYGAATDPDIVAWNLVRKVNLDANYNPVGNIFYFTKSYKDAANMVQTRNMYRRTTVMGGLVRQQASLLGGKLLAFAGARYDSVHYREHDYLTAASSFTPFIPGYQVGDLIDKTLTALKPNLGVNYKIRENFRAFANWSQGYFIAQGDNPVDIAAPTYKAETAEGWDYGFKGSLLNDRLSYTLCGFYISRQNVSVSDIDPLTGLTIVRRDGDQLVRGYEADLNWKMTDELNLLFSYGNVHSIYTDFGSAFPEAIGRKVQFVAPYNGSVSVKYNPNHGILKGFSTNVSVTFVGATPTEAPNAGDNVVTTAGVPAVTFSTGQWKLQAPAYELWSGAIRYQVQAKGTFSHVIALNVTNAFDKAYLRAGTSGATTRLLGDRRTFTLTYTIKH